MSRIVRFHRTGGPEVLQFDGNPESLERGKRFVVDGLAAGRLKPVLARTFPMADIVEAHRYLESNRQIGKIVVTT